MKKKLLAIILSMVLVLSVPATVLAASYVVKSNVTAPVTINVLEGDIILSMVTASPQTTNKGVATTLELEYTSESASDITGVYARAILNDVDGAATVTYDSTTIAIDDGAYYFSIGTIPAESTDGFTFDVAQSLAGDFTVTVQLVNNYNPT